MIRLRHFDDASPPGLITGVLFFLPVSIATFWTAWTTGMASIGEIGVGLLIGALTLAFPICMLIVKSWPYSAGRARLTLKSGERWKIGGDQAKQQVPSGRRKPTASADERSDGHQHGVDEPRPA
jgi:hypothetical protein